MPRTAGEGTFRRRFNALQLSAFSSVLGALITNRMEPQYAKGRELTPFEAVLLVGCATVMAGGMMLVLG
jgi:hypothetical protein